MELEVNGGGAMDCTTRDKQVVARGFLPTGLQLCLTDLERLDDGEKNRIVRACPHGCTRSERDINLNPRTPRQGRGLMLKLTTDADWIDLYIRASSIVSLQRIPGEKTQVWADGRGWCVTETPEQILAMPEMVAEIDRAMLATYPPMMVNNSDPSHAMSFTTTWPYARTYAGPVLNVATSTCISQHCPNWKGN